MTENLRVYKYGCRAPRELRLALQLLGQAWLYRDELRRVYNAHKRDKEALFAGLSEASHVLAYERHTAAVEEIGHVFAFERAAMWARAQGDLNGSIRATRARRGHLVDAGTYWLIEAALLQASKASGRDPIKAEPWDATGRIGAMIQAVDQFPADAWSHPRVTLTAPDARQHAELAIRVGEAKRSSPNLTIVWPIKFHRSFPEGAIVKQVAVQRTRNGHRYRWEALVTVAVEPAQRDLEAHGAVGIDVGWRREPAGMRVATHEGAAGVGVLRTDVIEAFEYADAVRGIRDRLFDQAKVYVKERQLPGWEHAHLWRDKDRMRRLARQVVDLGVAWYLERDKHLEDIECRARSRAIGRRLDGYRVYADALAKRYATAALEDMPMADWVGESETHAKERRRSSAALALLQTVVAQRFGEGRVDWVPPEYTTRTCADCGAVRDATVGPAAYWTCTSCGVVHHQDVNAAENLRVASERWIADGNVPRARGRKPKKGKGKQPIDGVARGDNVRMIVTARDPQANAAE